MGRRRRAARPVVLVAHGGLIAALTAALLRPPGRQLAGAGRHGQRQLDAAVRAQRRWRRRLLRDPLAARRVERLGTGCRRCPLNRRPTLLVFADSLAYYGPTGGLPADDPQNLAEYRCGPTRLGPRADRPNRVDVPRHLVGGHPGSAGLGGVAAGRRRGLRDQWHGFAALAVADRAARAHPLRTPAVAAALGARRLRLGAAAVVADRAGRAAAAPVRRIPRRHAAAIDFNRPGIPIVASLPSVHIAETYGKAHHGREGTVAAHHPVGRRTRRSARRPQSRRRRRGDERSRQPRRHPLELRSAPGRCGVDAQGAGRGRRSTSTASVMPVVVVTDSSARLPDELRSAVGHTSGAAARSARRHRPARRR